MSDEEKKLSSFLNMTVNGTVIVGALMTDAMSGAMGEMAAGMAEGVAGAFDNTGSAKQKGAEMRQEMSQNISAAVREMVGSMLPESRTELGAVIDNLTPAQRKDLLEDIGDESYGRAFEAIRKHDFGLPRLTEKLSVEDVIGYLALAKKEDPRLGEVMQSMMQVKQPRLFAEIQRDAKRKEEEADAKTDPVPKTVGKLPAKYLFPPGAETTISLRGKKAVKLAWHAKIGAGKSCENFGIRVEQGGSSMTSPAGGMTLESEGGKVTATMKNLEAFPLIVEIKAEE